MKSSMKMVKKMSSMKKSAPAMTVSAIIKNLSDKSGLKTKEVKAVLEGLETLAYSEVKKGKFTIPKICMLKLRTKKAVKAGKREIFGKMMHVKARPAKKVVKAFPVKAIKDSI